MKMVSYQPAVDIRMLHTQGQLHENKVPDTPLGLGARSQLDPSTFHESEPDDG